MAQNTFMYSLSNGQIYFLVTVYAYYECLHVDWFHLNWGLQQLVWKGGDSDDCVFLIMATWLLYLGNLKLNDARLNKE